jgi:2-methylfumaryl-CoA isomerase
MTGMLSHLTVVEGSAFVAAPLAGMSLAQLGAQVIRFDPIEGGLDYHRWPVTGDGTSIYWAGLNKGKQSIAIDVRRKEGQELVQQLIGSVGRFVTNFPARGWLDYERLKALRDDLLMVVVQGNHDGSTALDYTVHCATGFAAAAGPLDRDEPVNQTVPAWDLTTGLHAALAVLAADAHRERTGQGQCVSIALSDVAFATLAHLGYVGEVLVNGQQRPRVGNEVYGAFGRDFVSRDGKRAMVVAISKRQWSSLCEAAGVADAVAAIAAQSGLDFDDEGNRYLAREQLAPLFQRWFAEHDFVEIRARLDGHDVCWGPYQSFDEAVRSDPRIHANPLFTTLRQEGIGTYPVPGSPLVFSGVERASPAPAPRLGQHTDEILAERLGLTQAQIGRLREQRIVA